MSVKIKSEVNSESFHFRKAVASLKNRVGKVGWFTSYLDKNHTSVASIALQNELGNPDKNIPARPFIQPTINEQSQKWVNYMKSGVKKVLKGDLSIDDVLEVVGQRAAFDIKKTIAQGDFKPLAQATIDARVRRRLGTSRGSKLHSKYLSAKKVLELAQQPASSINLLNKPLVDTGYMRDTITNTVTDESEADL